MSTPKLDNSNSESEKKEDLNKNIYSSNTSNTNLDEDDTYFENGFLVFTAKYHLKRGFCCGNKCRHCPYNYQNVTK